MPVPTRFSPSRRGFFEELGYTDFSEIKDRNYFHSIYCRCPGGILVECAATAEGAFARDEPYDALGHQLLLPPWFEERRDEIMAMLDPITIPENNFPVHLEAVAVHAATPAGKPSAADAVGIGPSHRQAVFIDGGHKN